MKLARETAEWAGQILILIFATTAVAMPCVIPSGSMEGTLMTGDHVIVDRLAYSPHGSISGNAMPYEDVERGDIIVFRYPVDIRQNYVKRVIGAPGDHIRMEGGVVVRNGVRLKEDYIQRAAGPVQPSIATTSRCPRPVVYQLTRRKCCARTSRMGNW